MILVTARIFYPDKKQPCSLYVSISRSRAERDGTRAETTFRLSPKRTSPFKSAGKSVQSTAGSRGVRISVSNAGYTTFRGGVRVLATHSIRQFPLHFPSRASPCATTFRTQYTTEHRSCTYLRQLLFWRFPAHDISNCISVSFCDMPTELWAVITSNVTICDRELIGKWRVFRRSCASALRRRSNGLASKCFGPP